MSDKVKVVAYDTNWPRQFELEAGKIKSILGKNCYFVHHIGSTVVPGLAAKPIIDILPIVENIMLVEDKTAQLETLDYIARGEHGLAGRRYFENKHFHIHVYQYGHPAINRHVKFCDYLKIYPEERDAYAGLKINLAKQYVNDSEAYQAGKRPFIQRIERIKGVSSV